MHLFIKVCITPRKLQLESTNVSGLLQLNCKCLSLLSKQNAKKKKNAAITYKYH